MSTSTSEIHWKILKNPCRGVWKPSAGSFILLSMNKIELFNNPEFGNVRVVMDDANEPWFCACDVCTALKLANGRKAVTDHVHKDDVTNRYPIVDNLGRTQHPTFVNVSGLFALVFGSKVKKAVEFKHWVTSEVLPSIYKTGSYTLPTLTTEQKEMIRYAEACDICDRKEGFRALAKKIRFTTNMKIDARHVKAWMHDNGYLCSANGLSDYPTELALMLGLMIVRMPWNEIRYDRTPAKGKTRIKFTPKGARFFVNKMTDALMESNMPTKV